MIENVRLEQVQVPDIKRIGYCFHLKKDNRLQPTRNRNAGELGLEPNLRGLEALVLTLTPFSQKVSITR